MNTVELIYQEAKDLPETEAREVLNFVEFLKAKRRRELENKSMGQAPLVLNKAGQVGQRLYRCPMFPQ